MLHAVIKEQLGDTGIELTSFFSFLWANVYALSYEKKGIIKHTLIDTGDPHYQKQILPLLVKNGINPANIERIIVTHRHPDHCGLAYLLTEKSGAAILAHSNFKRFVEGEINQEERRWLGSFDPTLLKERNVEYLPPLKKYGVRNISGTDFPVLVDSIEIGKASKLSILGCPASTPSHSPDQLMVIFSPFPNPEGRQSRPTENIIFSGDLWLMTGPLDEFSLRVLPRRVKFGFYRLRSSLLHQGIPRRDPREQDSQAKEALKRGFPIIRVAPGHGEEFIGSRIIPNGLLADRDILVEMGYPPNTGKSLLKQRELATKVAAVLERAYVNFTKELLFWLELGYGSDEITKLLVRIFREQKDGNPSVKQDRKERRRRIKETLSRLKQDKAVPEELHAVAASTLSDITGVS